jgi:hypothetical protein
LNAPGSAGGIRYPPNAEFRDACSHRPLLLDAVRSTARQFDSDRIVHTLTSPSDYEANLTHHVEVIRQAVQAVAAVNNGVSARFQVGVHTLNVLVNGEFVRISPIVTDEPVPLRTLKPA